MPTYKAPLDDMRFVLNEVLNVSQLAAAGDFVSIDAETVNQFLAETGKLAEEVLFPLNASGDAEGCHHDRETKAVTTPKGFKDAYQQLCQAGITAVSCDPAFGGLGMPVVMNMALSELVCASNMAFAITPGLSHGAYNAIYNVGTEEQKNTYLPKLVSGEWSGTMCLTEPQCGTDLGLIKTKAVKQEDGSYKLSGTKIFISSGEQDLTENIVHLVLARIEGEDTPPGIKGISLFIVPKFLPGQGGAANARNPVFCGRIEEKMGLHGNSTCEMNFEQATGWLIGEAHKGMRGMFIMMNEARLAVGMQGIAASEICYQNAVNYALERKQGQPIDQKISDENLGKPAVPIISHPDVRRELLTIRSQLEAGRMLLYWVATQADIVHRSTDAKEKKRAKKLLDLLTPIVKAHFTDNGVDHTNSAIQVFGGHGYIKEHGMEQFNRDARIARLYEGTNGVQALDLIGRKVMKENLLPAYMGEIWRDMVEAAKAGVSPMAILRLAKSAWLRLWWHTFVLRTKAAAGVVLSKMGMGKYMGKVMVDAGAMATDYLNLFSTVAMGHMWLRMATVAKLRLKENPAGEEFYKTKINTAKFYFDRIMPRAAAYSRAIRRGSASLMSTPPEGFAHGQTTIGEHSWTKPEKPEKEAA